MYCVNGILFNHESPRRGKTFVTRKITQGVARIMAGLQDRIVLGNLSSLRDWGHAKDYVEAMWMMLRLEKPEDFVIATGEQHSVKEFCDICFAMAGMNIEWRGSGVDEEGIDTDSKKVVVSVSPSYFRPSEVETLLGDSTKARQILKWKPTFTFHELVHDMLQVDFKEYSLTLPSFEECMAKI